MATLSESTHAGEFLLSEGNGEISREVVTVASGQNLAAGAVVGKVTATGEYAVYDNAAVDGTEVAAGVLYDAVDASSAAAEGVAIVRMAEVDGGSLVWPDGIAQADQEAAITDLAALDIIVR